MSTQESGGGLTKWQIAALIGAPVAAACILGAFYYWKSSRTSEEDQDAEKGTEGDKASASKSGVPGNEAPQSDDVSEENLVMSGENNFALNLHLPCKALLYTTNTTPPLYLTRI